MHDQDPFACPEVYEDEKANSLASDIKRTDALIDQAKRMITAQSTKDECNELIPIIRGPNNERNKF